MPGDGFAACEEDVRRHDPDRYFSALFAPEVRRGHLFALYAFYRELAHAVGAAQEPMLVDVRLAWWRETLEGAREGKPRNHHVAEALAATLAANDLPTEMFEPIIVARAAEAGGGPFVNAAAAEAHADATTGALMRLAARILGAEADALAREAGIAYALAGRSDARYRGIDAVALARTHFSTACTMALPREGLPAFLPAALVPLYLRRSNPPLWRRQAALLFASLRGRL
jgi:phytoene synthase